MDCDEDSRHRIADITEFEERGARVMVEIGGKEVAVFRVDGEFFALENRCPHQSGPLCEGSITHRISINEDGLIQYDEADSVIQCPWHGWKFDIKSGQNIQSERYAVTTYDVIVEDGEIFVEK